jgi:hypothetical protein
MAAIQEMTVDYYVEGKGKEALKVKRVKVRLHPKITELTNLATPLRAALYGESGLVLRPN